MNKHTEVLQLQELHEVESGLNTRISEVYEYPPARKIAEKLFNLNDELNLLLNKGRYKYLPFIPNLILDLTYLSTGSSNTN